MEEIFKKINGFDNYSVSNFGIVRNDKTGKILKPSNTNGYYKVSLKDNENKSKTKRVHRLIGEAFIPNPNNKPVIDHIDNNKLNNDIANLRWASIKENTYNSKLSTRNTSGVKGISWHSRDKCWRARIRVNDNEIHLGSFINKEDAIKARLKKSIEIQGEFINKCELIQIKRIELDKELEELEREFLELIQ